MPDMAGIVPNHHVLAGPAGLPGNKASKIKDPVK
jgi:hypothetical protein